jgi:hypothetical protein
MGYGVYVNIEHMTCDIQHAKCKMQNAPCTIQYPLDFNWSRDPRSSTQFCLSVTYEQLETGFAKP